MSVIELDQKNVLLNRLKQETANDVYSILYTPRHQLLSGVPALELYVRNIMWNYSLRQPCAYIVGILALCEKMWVRRLLLRIHKL
jgi:hypothetical protein